MANFKLYYVSQSDFDAKIKNATMPHQQMLIYKALAAIGKPTRGQDVIDYAKKHHGLITRQESPVLAAWYFSDKRRHPAVTLGVPATQVEDPEARVERLKAEIEAKQKELEDAELKLLEMQEEAAQESEEQSEEASNEAAE